MHIRLPVRRRDGSVCTWTTIDEQDAWLDQWTWRLWKGYAQRRQDGRTILMHRLILGIDGTAWHTDHINGDGLDNRRSNLRPVTHAQNMQNRKRHRNNSSGFSAVYWDRDRQRWRAEVRLNGVKHRLGRYRTAAEAGAAADAFRAEHMPFWVAGRA